MQQPAAPNFHRMSVVKLAWQQPLDMPHISLSVRLLQNILNSTVHVKLELTQQNNAMSDLIQGLAGFALKHLGHLDQQWDFLRKAMQLARPLRYKGH